MNTYEKQFRLDTLFGSTLVVIAVAWLALGSIHDASRAAPAGLAAASIATAPQSAPSTTPGATRAQCGTADRLC